MRYGSRFSRLPDRLAGGSPSARNSHLGANAGTPKLMFYYKNLEGYLGFYGERMRQL